MERGITNCFYRNQSFWKLPFTTESCLPYGDKVTPRDGISPSCSLSPFFDKESRLRTAAAVGGWENEKSDISGGNRRRDRAHAIISILFPRIGRARPKDFSRGRKEALAEAGRRARKRREGGRGMKPWRRWAKRKWLRRILGADAAKAPGMNLKRYGLRSRDDDLRAY